MPPFCASHFRLSMRFNQFALIRLVKSARGAVSVFRPVRFPGAASRTGRTLTDLAEL